MNLSHNPNQDLVSMLSAALRDSRDGGGYGSPGRGGAGGGAGSGRGVRGGGQQGPRSLEDMLASEPTSPTSVRGDENGD